MFYLIRELSDKKIFISNQKTDVFVHRAPGWATAWANMRRISPSAAVRSFVQNRPFGVGDCFLKITLTKRTVFVFELVG